jgi:Anhydro-N-acetylmuramic acid kinase
MHCRSRGRTNWIAPRGPATSYYARRPKRSWRCSSRRACRLRPYEPAGCHGVRPYAIALTPAAPRGLATWRRLSSLPASNRCVLERLDRDLPQCHIATTAALGIDPDWVEAIAFAWLAKQTPDGRPGNLPTVTGAGGRARTEGNLPGVANRLRQTPKKREPQLPFDWPSLRLSLKRTIRNRRCWLRSDF